jgi:hypothetical protein
MRAASAAAPGTGNEDEQVTLIDIVQRLKAIEDIVHLMQLVPEAVATLEGTMRDMGQQQAALVIALTCVECQVQDPSRGPPLSASLTSSLVSGRCKVGR